MIKLLITNNVDSTYDKIFKIIESYSTFLRVSTKDEYETEEGYVIVLNGIDDIAFQKIRELKNVKEI